MSAVILVVEDEPAIQELVAATLTFAGYKVLRAGDAESAHRIIADMLPDLIVSDWVLPGNSGIVLLRQLRGNPHTAGIPVIMLTARVADQDAVLALESGADDFITKPFSPRQLVARIYALLRRRAPHLTTDDIRHGALHLDPSTRSVTVAGRPVVLSPTEFRLLHFFMAQPGRVHNRAYLLDKVWNMNTFLEERTVDAHVGRLRSALEVTGEHARIETVRGLGYRFVVQGAADKPVVKPLEPGLSS